MRTERRGGPPVEGASPPNRRLLLPYLLPYLAYVALGPSRLGPEWAYSLRLLVVPALLAWGWRWYPALAGPRSAVVSAGIGAGAGLVGTLLWIGLLAPFVPAGGDPWRGTAFWLRMAAAGLVVPLFEELLMRGYFLRAAVQWDRARRQGDSHPLHTALDDRSLLDLEPGAWSAAAVAISTLAFVLGHNVPEWPAATAYGLLMAWLWIARRDLVSCIVAHGVTNIALGFYVRATGQWTLW